MTSNPYEDLDDYDLHSLATHLYEASMFIELVENIIKQNMFIQTRYSREGSYAGYLRDLELVWRWADSDQAWHVSHQIRCALIRSSIYALTANMPPALLAQLVQSGLWSATGAVEFIAQIQNEEQRAEAILAIAPSLSEELKSDILKMVEALPSELWRGKALAGLAAHLPAMLHSQALDIVQSIQDDLVRRAIALCGLGPHLRENLLNRALDLAETVSELERPDVLRALMPRLSNDELSARALAMALNIGNSEKCIKALGVLAPYLPDSLREQALDRIVAINAEEITRGHEMEHQGRHLLSKYFTLDKIVTRDEEMERWSGNILPHERVRIEALRALAPHLSLAESIKHLVQARTISNKSVRLNVLTALAPHLPDLHKAAVIAEVLTEIHAFPVMNYSVDINNVLFNLMPQLPNALKAEALTLVGKMVHSSPKIEKEDRIRVLAILAPCLSKTHDAGTIAQMLAVLRTFRDKSLCVYILSELVEHLPNGSELKTQIVQEAKIISKDIKKYSEEYIETWCRLVPFLPESEKIEKLKEMEVAASTIEDKNARAFALGNIAPYLPDPAKEAAFQAALEAVPEIRHEKTRAELLCTLAPCLPDNLKLQALEIALSINGDEAQIEALSGLTPNLPVGLQDQTMWQMLGALDAASYMDEDKKANVLVKLALDLPDDMKIWPLRKVLAFQNRQLLIAMLHKLKPRMPDLVKIYVLFDVLEMKDKVARAKTLSILASYLLDDILIRIWRAISIQYQRAHTGRVRMLAQVVLEKLRAWVSTPITRTPYPLQEALTAARLINDECERVEVLSGLAEYLPQPKKKTVLQEALVIARAIKNEDQRANALRSVAPHLSDSLKTEILTAYSPPPLTMEDGERLLEEAMDYEDSVDYHGKRRKRLRELLSILPILPYSLQSKALQHALDAVPIHLGVFAQPEDFDKLATYLVSALAEELPKTVAAILKKMQDLQQHVERGQVAPAADSPAGRAQRQTIPKDELRIKFQRMLSPGGTEIYAQVSLLSALATYLPNPLKEQTLRTALVMAMKAETHIKFSERTLPDGHIFLFKKIINQWRPLHFASLDDKQAFWRESLHILAQRRRPQFLHDLGTLAPLIEYLDGQVALEETFYAVCDVTKWWP